jgi:hypothetical protein
MTARASAQPVLVSDITQPTRAITTIFDQLWAAQSFATNGSGYFLTSINALLGPRTGAPNIVAQLRADGPGAPTGSLLTTFTVGAVPTGGPSMVSLTPASVVALAPSSTYWLVLGVAGADNFGWAYEDGNVSTGPGSIGPYGYSTDGGATWPPGLFDTPNPYQFQVNVRPLNAVPEPATLGLVALGLLGTFVARRHAARR